MSAFARAFTPALSGSNEASSPVGDFDRRAVDAVHDLAVGMLERVVGEAYDRSN